MKKLNFTGDIILDTDAVLVSGDVTIKSEAYVGFCDFKVTSTNEAVFDISIDEIITNNKLYDVIIHCYDNANNKYSLVSENNEFPNVHIRNNIHLQYLLNSDSILNKDVIKLLYT